MQIPETFIQDDGRPVLWFWADGRWYVIIGSR